MGVCIDKQWMYVYTRQAPAAPDAVLPQMQRALVLNDGWGDGRRRLIMLLPLQFSTKRPIPPPHVPGKLLLMKCAGSAADVGATAFKPAGKSKETQRMQANEKRQSV